MKLLRRNIRLLYVAGVSDMWFHLPIAVLFGVYHLGWSYGQVGSIIWAQSGALFAFDVFGGFIADRFGRKKTCVIGVCIEIGAFLPFVLTASYPLLLLASAGIGIGRALQTATLDALVYEHAASLRAVAKYQEAAALINMFRFASRAIASFIGGIAFAVSPTLPYWLTIGALVCGLAATLLIRVPSKAPDNPAPVTRMWRTVRDAFVTYRNNRTLLRFVIIAGVSHLLANVLYGLYQPFYIEKEVSSEALGTLLAIVAVISGAGSLLMRWLSSRYSAHTIQSAGVVAYTLTGVGLLILPMPFVLAAPLSMALVSGFASNELTYIHTHTSDNVRASVQSIYSSINTLGLFVAQIVVFSLVGLLPHAYIIGAATIELCVILCLGLHWRKTAQPDDTPLVAPLGS